MFENLTICSIFLSFIYVLKQEWEHPWRQSSAIQISKQTNINKYRMKPFSICLWIIIYAVASCTLQLQKSPWTVSDFEQTHLECKKASL